MSEPTIYTLKYPLELRTAAGEVTETVRELKLRRLTGFDMEKLDATKGSGSGMLALVAASADVPPSTVRKMDAQDVVEAAGIVTGFLGGSLPTGDK